MLVDVAQDSLGIRTKVAICERAGLKTPSQGPKTPLYKKRLPNGVGGLVLTEFNEHTWYSSINELCAATPTFVRYNKGLPFEHLSQVVLVKRTG